jgi:hypothetical protein
MPAGSEDGSMSAAESRQDQEKPPTRRIGHCACGSVRFRVDGPADRVGICHCTDCRRESGSAFTYFGVWPLERFASEGTVATHRGRSFCPTCGSRVFAVSERAAEIKLGALEDAPAQLKPVYELWIKRREPWLAPVPGAEQYQEDKPA